MEFLVFGEDYNRHPSSTQHLINEIKKTYDVQWVNSIGMRRPKINPVDLARIFEKLSGNKTTNYPEEKLDQRNLTIVKPIVYPLAESALMRSFNKFLMKKKLHKKKDLRRVVWLTLPSAVDYLEVSEGDLVVYYCCDDFGSLAGVDHETVIQKEKELIEKADIVFTTSEELYKKINSIKTYMLPHGVHKMFFNVEQKALDENKLKLGFYGGIDTRLDYELIKKVLDSDERLTLEMVGHLDSNVNEEVFNHPRIKRYSALQHKDLVKKLSEWDMLLLPFLHNGYATHCNPLKLREYLATGKPVISTDIPAVREYEGFLEIREGVNEWLEGINNFCQEATIDKERRISGIQEMLAKETWDHRAEEAVMTILHKAWYND